MLVMAHATCESPPWLKWLKRHCGILTALAINSVNSSSCPIMSTHWSDRLKMKAWKTFCTRGNHLRQSGPMHFSELLEISGARNISTISCAAQSHTRSIAVTSGKTRQKHGSRKEVFV